MSTTVKPFEATGRRKTSTAHVWLSEGTGRITVNGRIFEDYLPTLPLQNVVLQPFQVTNNVNKFDLRVVCNGGGIHGQVGAIRLAIARALCEFNNELRPKLREFDMLTRDPRMKERKKPGQPGARKKFQFSKR